MQGITNFGQSLMNLGQGVHNSQQRQAQQAQQARADEQAIAVGTFRNQFTAQTRAVADELNNIMRNFNSQAEMQAYDIGGWFNNKREEMRGLLEQFSHDPMMQDRMRVEFDANFMQFQDQVYGFTREAYREMATRETTGNFTQLAQMGDINAINEYENLLLSAFDADQDSRQQLDRFSELDGILQGLDSYIRSNPDSENLESVRDQRENVVKEIEQLENYFDERSNGQLLYSAHQIREMANQYRKEAAGIQLQQSVFNLTPSAAREFIMNGDSEFHNHFTFNERQELATSVSQQQAVRQSELNVENNQRIQDGFLRVNTITDARRLLNQVKNSNNGVTDGQLPGSFINSGTQMQWVNALENMITRMEIEALPPPPPEVVVAEPQEPPNLMGDLQVRIASQHVTREEAIAEANRLVGTPREQGGISPSDHRTLLSLIESRTVSPNLNAAFQRIDSEFRLDRDNQRIQNARVRDQLNSAIRNIMQETGLGIDAVTSLTHEQIDTIVSNLIDEERNRRIRLTVSAGDINQSILGANNNLFTRNQPVEQLLTHIENGRFLGLENNEEYRSRALLIAQEGAATLQQKLNNPNIGHQREGNYVFGMIAPAGTQITQIELGRGLLPQFFVPSPYTNEFSVEVNGQRGFIVSMMNGTHNDLEYVIYDPTRQQQGGNSLNDYRPLTDANVRTIMQNGVNNYRRSIIQQGSGAFDTRQFQQHHR